MQQYILSGPSVWVLHGGAVCKWAFFEFQSTDKHNATNQITIHNIVIIFERDTEGKDAGKGAPFYFYFVANTACMRRRFGGPPK